LAERRKDFVESQALVAERAKVKDERDRESRVFPWNGDEEEKEAFRSRRLALQKAAQDQAEL
jgi:hypothetical protein